MKKKRVYIPPNRTDYCKHCGNDGSNIVTCAKCYGFKHNPKDTEMSK
jgi:hypothetical protein